MNKRNFVWISAAALAVSGCATTAAAPSTASASGQSLDAMLGNMLSGKSSMQGSELDKKVAEADAYPLGSKNNPVRAQMPPGQRAYLSRLRCADLKAPSFSRIGSAGMSPYGNIVDVYSVTCKDSEPASSEIFIDMYHGGHVEDRAVPGFGIVGGRSGSSE